LFPRTRRWTWVNIHFCAKKNQTFTVDHWSRLISTYLSTYLELSRHYPLVQDFSSVF
jgi:hypothetical protein